MKLNNMQMMMKGYIILAAALMATVAMPAAAQQMRFGIEAGGTISNSSWKPENGQKAKGVGGYTVGLTLEAEIFDKTWLQSGLTFIIKGAMSEIKGVDIPEFDGIKYDKTNTFRPMYVQIPITVAYKFDITSRTRFFVAGGTFLALGIGGEYNDKTTYNNVGVNLGWESMDESRNVFSSNAMKRFDCGLNAGAGFEFGRLILRVGYDWSLLNIAKKKDVLGANEFKNRSIAIAAGLKF